MSQLELVDSQAFERIKDVADLYVQGVTSHFTIARRLGIKAVEAKHALEQWHIMLQNDAESKDLAREHLNVMVKRYDDLIHEANDNLKNLKSLAYDEKVSAQINSTIKVIGDLDKVRVDLLQKAGLLDAHDLGDELAEREEREAALINILRNHICEDCKTEVAYQIGKLTGQVEVIKVEDV